VKICAFKVHHEWVHTSQGKQWNRKVRRIQADNIEQEEAQHHREGPPNNERLIFKEARQTIEGIRIIGTTETFNAKRARKNVLAMGHQWVMIGKPERECACKLELERHSSNLDQAKEMHHTTRSKISKSVGKTA
jgi:hypothetical protein